MKAWIVDKICSWCVVLLDWWAPSPEQMQELSEAKAEFRQALTEAFGMDRFVDWLTRIMGK